MIWGEGLKKWGFAPVWMLSRNGVNSVIGYLNIKYIIYICNIYYMTCMFTLSHNIVYYRPMVML